MRRRRTGREMVFIDVYMNALDGNNEAQDGVWCSGCII